MTLDEALASTHRDPSFPTVGSDASMQVTNSGPGGTVLSRVYRNTKTIIERTGSAVRVALLKYSSAEECSQFEAELRSALARAAEDLDLSGPLEVLAHWHALAMADANPFTDEEFGQIERMDAGDYAGLHTRDDHGNWVRL
jgi:hypothetical protein